MNGGRHVYAEGVTSAHIHGGGCAIHRTLGEGPAQDSVVITEWKDPAHLFANTPARSAQLCARSPHNPEQSILYVISHT